MRKLTASGKLEIGLISTEEETDVKIKGWDQRKQGVVHSFKMDSDDACFEERKRRRLYYLRIDIKGVDEGRKTRMIRLYFYKRREDAE